MKYTLVILLLFVLFISVVSCSRSSNPTTPMLVDTPQSGDNESASCSESNQSLNPNYGVFGMWQVHIDVNSMSVEIIPARNAKAIGHIFDSDLSQFLTVSPCSNCLGIPLIGFDGYGNLLVKVEMKHPFADITKRPDLHGFDVRGIFVIPDYESYPKIKVTDLTGAQVDASLNTNVFLNADGYTSHYDWLVTDTRYFMNGYNVSGSINPFLRFFESYVTGTFDPNAPVGWNVMPVGSSTYNRIAVFNSSKIGTSLDFFLIADVAYGQSAVLANRTSPQYYLPSFNRTEPWRIEYWIENNNLDSSDVNSSADVVVQVFDWQHNATVDPGYPQPSNLSGIRERSQVSKVELSVPALRSEPIIVTAPESGDGSPSNPLRYRLTIENETGSSGTFTGLLAVRDELDGLSSPHGRAPVPPSPAGFPYETNDILDYSIYHPVYINYPQSGFLYGYGTTFTNNEGYVPWDNQFARQYATTDFRTTIMPEFFMDPSHRRFQYRWDYDYDGVTFDLDGAGCPSPLISFNSSGKKNVGFRVRTNSVPPKEFIYQFPVYAYGVGYKEQLEAFAARTNTTSSRRGHSVKATAEKFYMVYANELGGNRDIWLAIVDRYGEVDYAKITDSPNVDFQPSVEVITTGANAGVYVVYTSYDGADAFLYSTYGNLDGSGFEPSHIKRVTTASGVAELEGTIHYQLGKLNCYYTVGAFIATAIFGAHSYNFAQSWVEDGRVVDNGSIGQLSPTVCVNGWSRMSLVWEDWIEATDRGSDIWYAESTDGSTFTEMRNTSIYQTKMYETSPSCTYGSGSVSIAYLASPTTSDRKQVRLRLLNRYSDSIFDYPVNHGYTSTTTHTQPCVSFVGNGRLMVSYGIFDTGTNDLKIAVLEAIQNVGLNSLYFFTHVNEEVGTTVTTNNGFEAYPCMATYQPIPNVNETFVAFRNFMSGYYESSIPLREVFGEIDVAYIISERDYELY